MLTHFSRYSCALFAACLLLGCGGGDSEPAPTTGTESTSTAPAAPGTPSGAGSSSTPGTSSSGTRVDSSTPDGTVRKALQAVQDNEFERVWELLPKSMQTNINDLFKEFGKQVDAEMWDKSFNLLNRCVSVMISKQDMIYQTPEVQQSLGMVKGLMGASGDVDPETLTPENIKAISSPMLKILSTLLNSELSSGKKLKSFDGRVFFAKTLNPVVAQFIEFTKLALEQVQKMDGLPGNQEMPTGMLLLTQLEDKLSKVNVRTESMDGDFAVVVIEFPNFKGDVTSNPNGVSIETIEIPDAKMNFVRVDGKWVPEDLGLALPQQLTMAKAFIPMIAGQINAQKSRVMPALEQIEPLIDVLQKSKTQEEFNTAFANFYSQAPQLMATAMGMPGIVGGTVQVSPVTIEFQGEVTDKQLGETIQQLEALTDDPGQAITLPKRDFGQVMLEITPVSDLQAFASAINFAKRAEYDAARKTIVIELEPLPEPVEIPPTEN